MGYLLLDTSTASLLHPKKSKSSHRIYYEPHFKENRMVISFQTVAEMLSWAETNNWNYRNREHLNTIIRDLIVIPYTIKLAETWAQVMNISQHEGRRFSSGDCWIAATAVLYEIPLLTHDKDFMNHDIPGLRVICYADNE